MIRRPLGFPRIPFGKQYNTTNCLKRSKSCQRTQEEPEKEISSHFRQEVIKMLPGSLIFCTIPSAHGASVDSWIHLRHLFAKQKGWEPPQCDNCGEGVPLLTGAPFEHVWHIPNKELHWNIASSVGTVAIVVNVSPALTFLLWPSIGG